MCVYSYSVEMNKSEGQASKYENLGDETLVIGSPGKKAEAECISFSTSYCAEWEKLFTTEHFLKNLRDYGLEGKLRSSRFRSVCWKVYLETLPDDFNKWIDKTKEWRKRYEILKDQLLINPRESEEKVKKVNDPLSQADESPWNRFFQDNELRLTIKQDVIRTFPDVEFFKDADLHSKMVDILFCYSRLNNRLSYRQGMHELLAPLIFILHCDHQAFLHASEIEPIGDVLREVLNPRYIEHDAFAMFCQIMDTAEHWYVSKEISPTIKPKNVFQSQPFARPQDTNPSNVIVNKLTRIQDYLLKKYDPELYMYLEKLEIPPQIYGIRWVRLLFGREFPMQDLLVVWDAVFADSISFDLVDYIFVAMLMYLRDALLTSDYPTCLHFLMKYPPVGDVNYFIQKARFLRDPNDHFCPPHYTYQKPAQFMHSSYGDVLPGMNGLPGSLSAKQTSHAKANSGTKMAEKASSFMSSGFASLTRKFSSNSPQQRQRRGMSLPVTERTNRTSLSEQNSPASDIYPPSSGISASNHKRTGSSASMSQVENGIQSYNPAMRGAVSSQSLTRTDSLEEGMPAEYMHLEPVTSGSKYSGSMPSSPRRHHGPASRNKRHMPHTTRNAELEQRISFLLGRLNDLENMCLKCADKMDTHIDKLQVEMLRKEMENEDELLLSLAGLKVVKDVLKGELKPSALFFDDDIKIRESHYEDSPVESVPEHALQPQESSDSGYHYSKTEHARAHVNKSNSSSPEFSSDADLTSPEYLKERHIQNQKYMPVYSHHHNIEQEQPRSPSAILKTDLLKKKEVEMLSFQTSHSDSKRDEKLNEQRNNEPFPKIFPSDSSTSDVQEVNHSNIQREVQAPATKGGTSESFSQFVGGFKQQLFSKSSQERYASMKGNNVNTQGKSSQLSNDVLVKNKVEISDCNQNNTSGITGIRE